MLRLKAEKAQGRRRFLKSARGNAGIEFAMILPIMVLMVTGMIDLTNIFSANRKATLATNTIGDLVTQANGKITKSELEGIYNAARPIIDPIPTSKMVIKVAGYRKVGKSIVKQWSFVKGEVSCAAPEIPDSTKTLMQDGNDIIVTVGCFNVRTLTGYIFGDAVFHLREEVLLRPRQSATLECEDCS